jgi:membrane associated rhomboid family serine protease
VLQTSQKLNRDDFGWISYYSLVGQNEDRRGLEAAWKHGAAKMHKPPRFLLEAQAGPFDARTGDTLSLFLAAYGFAAGLWLLLALGMKIDAPKRRQWLKRAHPPNRDLKVAWPFVIPRTNFFFTPLLLHLNLLIWLFMVFRGQGLNAMSGNELLAWGALYAPAVNEGELWRLITFLFVHAGIMHLANNLLSLVMVGFLVEQSFGRWWFVAVYLATGLAGGVASLLWKPTVIIVGASGAIFGVAGFGLTLLLLKRQRFAFERPLLLKAAALYFGINLLMGALLPNVDLVGHLAGLVSGIFIGLVSSSLISDPPKNQ